MIIIKVKDYSELSRKAASLVAEELAKKPDLALCLPTGATPLGMYEQLTDKNLDFSKATMFLLDEYAGLGVDDEESFACYMCLNFLDLVNFRKENVFMFNGKAADLDKECEDYEKKIEEKKIDLAILGIGKNGHVGFNEPGSSFSSQTRVVSLSEQTRESNAKYFEKGEVPSKALTVGLKTIMGAKKIILLASGAEKAEVIKQLVEGEISYQLPASVINTHKDAVLVVDRAASKLLK
ncbi:glucosamine-6-phosphate deaminase [Candidatus Woesearchaeota archaeon]|nr:glucosamine-6-phosphate deaminase [Candidatus Woesearchaeota archaeon]